MAEHKRIGSINIVTDSETSYDKIGDVDGGFDEIELKNYIKKYGHQGLCEQLTVMQWQIWNIVREINSERDRELYTCVEISKKDENNR